VPQGRFGDHVRFKIEALSEQRGLAINNGDSAGLPAFDIKKANGSLSSGCRIYCVQKLA
jgi:hypothetical protein